MKIKIKAFKINNLIALMMVVFILSGITLAIGVSRRNIVKEKFQGIESQYKGVIEVWNIDDFEAGTMSKSVYLEKICQMFSKKYKGVFFVVKNILHDELDNLLSEGKIPDIISYSYSTFGKIKNFLTSIESGAVLNNFKNAGIHNGEMLGVPWCYGTYSLISNTERLQYAGVEVNSVLSDIVLTASYDKKLKKSNKHIYSLSATKNDFINPESVLNKQTSDITTQNTVLSTDFYDAYVEFNNYNSTLLLGTHRDVVRMERKKALGAVNDVIYEHLTNYTDLVQFISCVENDNIDKYHTSSLFVNYLCCDSQKLLSDLGMFSPCLIDCYSEGEFENIENLLSENIEVKKLA